MSRTSTLPKSTIEDVEVRRLVQHADDRGWLAEAWRHDEIDHMPAMGYVSFTRCGVARGPHEHRAQSDYFAFLSGTFRVQLWDTREGSSSNGESMSFEVGEDCPAIVVIPPGVVHAYTCVSPAGGLVVNLPDRLYAGVGKNQPVDEIRHENDPESPFRIER